MFSLTIFVMSKYSIAGIQFRTKKSIIDYVHGILGRYQVGDELVGEDYEFALCLLQRHQRAVEKVGRGVRSIRKIENRKGDGAFELVRIDGTTTDFSFYNCISPKNKKRELVDACRSAVCEDIHRFKIDYFKENGDGFGMVVCPLTGERVSIDNSHADHTPPKTFDTIVKEWLSVESLAEGDIEIGGKGDNETSKYIADLELRERFRKYHEGVAVLRVTSPRGNLSISRKVGGLTKTPEHFEDLW